MEIKKLQTNDKNFVMNCKKVQKGTLSFEKFLEKIELRKYIPIQTKVAVAEIIQLLIADSQNIEGMVQYEDANNKFQNYLITKFLFMISQYIGIQIGMNNCNADFYDLLCEIGLVQFIKCNVKDFEDFSEIIDNYTGMKYYALTEVISNLFADLPTQAKVDEMVEAFNKLDQEKLEIVKEAADFTNDEITKTIVSSIKEESVKISKDKK